jgi:membrane protease YdiL (CAAX protease family)
MNSNTGLHKFTFTGRLLAANPFMQLVLLVCALSVGLLLVGFAAIALAPAFGVSPSQVQAGFSPHTPALTRYLMAVQSIGVFMLPPFLAAAFIHRKRACIFLGVARKPLRTNVLLTVVALVAAIPFISLAANVNAQLPLPDWAISADHAATDLTTGLIFTPDTATMLLNMLVIALIPAVSEELLFRGYLQRVLCSWTKKPHVAILISAAAFSALHIQLEGFIPRFLLGALFGYLFYWSGSLWLPIAAHFTNNAATVCAYFYAARSGVDIESLEVETSANTLLALLSVLVVANLLGQIYQREKLRRKRRLRLA